MKKSTFFFLVLVLAAAVVTGSALGVISNFDIIKNAAQHNNQSAGNDAVADNPSSETEQKNAGQEQAQDDKAIQTASASAANTATEVMVVSPEENAEITSMLVKLGMASDADSDDFVKEYQANHGIQPTGSIDSITLDTIINDVKMKRVTQMTKQ